MPNALTKHAAASAAASASSAPSAGSITLKPHCGRSGCSRIAWKVSHSETKPLSGGSAGDRRAADQEHEARDPHPVDQPAEPVQVARAGGGLHRAGADEQQALEQRMVEHVQQRRGQRERRTGRVPVGAERHREAEAEEDDADVLDRAVGEQPLQVAAPSAHTARRAPRCPRPAPAPRPRSTTAGRRAGRRRRGRRHRPRPWSSPRSSARRHGWGRRDAPPAARRAAARARPWRRRRTAQASARARPPSLPGARARMAAKL